MTVLHNSMTKPDERGDYLIPFTEFVLPDGRRRALQWHTKDRALAAKADAIITNGFTFEIERLRGGVISVTITHENGGDMSHVLSHSDTTLTTKIEAMIRGFNIAKQTVHIQRMLTNDEDSDD
jgi:hypothetical protein